MTGTVNLWVQWHSFLTATSTSANVLSINTMPAVVHVIWVVYDERLKWRDAAAFHIVSYIHFHSSFTLIPSSVSYFCVTAPRWVRVSKFHLSAPTRGGWQSGWGPGERHQTWDAGLGSLPHPISIWVAGPSICLRMIWSWLSQEGKKRPSTNDKWQSQNKHKWGRGGEKELNHSFIIHQP